MFRIKFNKSNKDNELNQNDKLNFKTNLLKLRNR